MVYNTKKQLIDSLSRRDCDSYREKAEKKPRERERERERDADDDSSSSSSSIHVTEVTRGRCDAGKKN